MAPVKSQQRKLGNSGDATAAMVEYQVRTRRSPSSAACTDRAFAGTAAFQV